MTWRGAVRSAGPYIILHANTLIAVACGAGCAVAGCGWVVAGAVRAASPPPAVDAAPRVVLLACLLSLLLALLAPYTTSPAPRPLLLSIHAMCHLCVCGSVVGGGVWAWRQWQGARDGVEGAVRDAGEVRDRVEDLLDALGRYHSVPLTIKQIIKETQREVPVLAAAAGAGAVLYVLSALLSAITGVLLAWAALTSEESQVRAKRRPYLRPPPELGRLLHTQ